MDWNKLNKVVVRNLDESVDFHDLVKMLLYRKLRRLNKNVAIYTELPLKSEIPDIYLEYKGDIYVWEIQENITKEWESKVNKKYEDVNLIIVPLKKLSHNFEELSKQLNEYCIKVK
jgi:hypothetical protein